MRIRLLTERDLPDLMVLKESAGWNQTEQDWRLFLEYEPNGCFGMEVDGRIVASAAGVCYGQELAWIAMVLTLPDYRGRGFGKALTQEAIRYAGGRVIRLDASDLGRPIYEALGFVAECPVERWSRGPGPVPEPPVVSPVQYDAAYDAAVFGADRSILLSHFARCEAASVPGAYAFGRAGSNAPFFGPCVSETAEGADALLRWFVSRHASETVFTDLFPHHADAVAVASAHGFTPVRRLTRMALNSTSIELPDPRIYATGSFSWG